MKTSEEIFTYFNKRVADIIGKYSVQTSSTDYDNQYLRLSTYFGDFNKDMIDVDKDLDNETSNILCNHINEDMDLPFIIDNLYSFCNLAKLQYITQQKLLFS